MPSIQLTDDQVVEIVNHLSPSRQSVVLQSLVRAALAARATIDGEDIDRVREWCVGQGLDWDSMTDGERSWRCVECFAAGGLAPVGSSDDDFEVIINNSLRTMKENQVYNRERAVTAITQKNYLQNLVQNQEVVLARLQEKIDVGLSLGHKDLVKRLERERELHSKCLDQLQESLATAMTTSEAVKDAIRREEELFRLKTAQALALKADFKRRQVEINLLIDQNEVAQPAGSDQTTLHDLDEDPFDTQLSALQDRLDRLGVKMRRLPE